MILITGNGKLANELLKFSSNDLSILSLSRKQMDITDMSIVSDTLQKYMELSDYPKYLIHTAALTKPMKRVDLNPIESISVNIAGTVNVARICHEYGIKFIYISTDYVYDSGIHGQSENSSLNPPNNYGWSKLGGECVARLIPNSLILRCALCDIPFRHDIAFADVWRNSITHKDAAKIILKLKDENGVINLGGKYQSVYDFVSNYQKIKKGYNYNKVPNVNDVHLMTNRLSEILEKVCTQEA